jgi:hypothetical protein
MNYVNEQHNEKNHAAQSLKKKNHSAAQRPAKKRHPAAQRTTKSKPNRV